MESCAAAITQGAIKRCRVPAAHGRRVRHRERVYALRRNPPIVAEKPWVSSLSFEASFPIRGKVLQAVMCDCEEEGDVRIRVARNPKKGWDYSAKEADTFLDIHAFDPKGFYLKVRPGDWVEGDIVCSGYLRKGWANRGGVQGDGGTGREMKSRRASAAGSLRADRGVRPATGAPASPCTPAVPLAARPRR